MSDARSRLLEEVFDSFIRKAVNVDLVFEIEIDEHRQNLLSDLHTYCVHQVVSDIEPGMDPRKINYKASEEMKLSLLAIFLSFSLVEQYRAKQRTKEYFIENISVFAKDSEEKLISFGDISLETIEKSINQEVIEDWKIYRDREGLGVSNLIDEKTNLRGLEGFIRGGDPVYEFARFRRKYVEMKLNQKVISLDIAKDNFRNAMIGSLASEYAKQQISRGVDPMVLIESIFKGADEETSKIRGNIKTVPKIDSKVESEIVKFLEFDDK